MTPRERIAALRSQATQCENDNRIGSHRAQQCVSYDDYDWLLDYAERLTEAAENLDKNLTWHGDESDDVLALRAILRGEGG